MKQKVYMFIGLPGSGKSTETKKIFESDNKAVIVNRDQLRIMMAGSYQNYLFSKEREDLIQNTLMNFAKNAIQAGFNVIFDETSLRKHNRENLIKSLRMYNKDIHIIGIFLNTSIEECKRRRKIDTKDTDTDWDLVIEKMCRSFDIPKEIEFDEFIVI